MDRLRCIEVFVVVAEQRSFSKAARSLEMSRSNVTKHVAFLEQHTGARLLLRTTKSVGLTEAGATMLENGLELLARVEQINNDVRHSVATARGAIRIGIPPAFGTSHMVPIIAAFVEEHPGIEVVLALDNGTADLATDGLDLTIRIASSLKDASHISQLLARVPQRLVASRSYINAAPPLATPEDLSEHNCLVNLVKSPTRLWRFSKDGKQFQVRVSGSLHSDVGEPLRHAAILGHGVSMHPLYMIDEDLQAGRLVSVLGDYAPAPLEIYVVYPSRRNQPIRTRRFLEFLRRWFATSPAWAM